MCKIKKTKEYKKFCDFHDEYEIYIIKSNIKFLVISENINKNYN